MDPAHINNLIGQFLRTPHRQYALVDSEDNGEVIAIYGNGREKQTNSAAPVIRIDLRNSSVGKS